MAELPVSFLLNSKKPPTAITKSRKIMIAISEWLGPVGGGVCRTGFVPSGIYELIKSSHLSQYHECFWGTNAIVREERITQRRNCVWDRVDDRGEIAGSLPNRD